MALPEREPSAAVSRSGVGFRTTASSRRWTVVRGANVSLCIPVAGVTLRSSRLRAGLKTKLAACRSGYSFRSFRVRPRAAPAGPRAGPRPVRVTRTGSGEARENVVNARATAGAAYAGAGGCGRAGFARVCRDVPRRLTESYITVGTHPVPDRASQPEPPSTQRAPFGFPIALRSASRRPVTPVVRGSRRSLTGTARALPRSGQVWCHPTAASHTHVML